MNLHAKELVNVIMWTNGNFEENIKTTPNYAFPTKIYKAITKT